MYRYTCHSFFIHGQTLVVSGWRGKRTRVLKKNTARPAAYNDLGVGVNGRERDPGSGRRIQMVPWWGGCELTHRLTHELERRTVLK